MTSKSAWTQAERALGELFGVSRRPLSGSLAGDDDIRDHPRIYGESKLRAAWSVFTLWRAVKAKASKHNKAPILRLKEKHAKGGLVVVHEYDLPVVVVEWLAARDDEELCEIEAAVRRRRSKGLDEL